MSALHGPTPFFKMTGSGNDFIFLDGRSQALTEWPAARIRSLCARRLGVGADGLVFLEPGSGPDLVRFHFFNADGERTAMCGNASLCATRLAVRLGLAAAESVTLETDAGLVQARCLPGQNWMAELALPDVGVISEPEIVLEEGEIGIWRVTVGVPHVVIEVAEIDAVSMERGRRLRSHPALGRDGANVNFVCSRGDKWRIRTYERGVEAETLACGTGAVGAACVLAVHRGEDFPIRFMTQSGAELAVSGAVSAGHVTGVRLAGEGKLVYEGRLGA